MGHPAPARHGSVTGLFDVLNVALMVFLMLITFYPFYYCIVLSFSEASSAMSQGSYFFPRSFTLQNYAIIFSQNEFLVAILNSVTRTVLGTILHVLFTATVAFGLSKKILFKRGYMIFFVITMYFSGGLIPTYLVIKSLGLVNSYLVYIVPMMWSFFHALLFIAYYESIPDSIQEQAHIDGAGAYRILYTIILPMCTPILATIALFIAVAHWNSFFDTMIYTSSPKLITLQYLLMKLVRQVEYLQQMINENASRGGLIVQMPTVSPMTVRVATMVVVTVPILCVYPFLQRYFIKGIMLGAVKG